MKLSELVEYKNAIDAFTLNDIHFEARHRLDKVIHEVIHHRLQFNNFAEQTVTNGHAVDSAFAAFSDTIKNIRTHLHNLIEERHAEQLVRSLQWFQNESIYETSEYILQRRLHLDSDSADLLQGRITRYTDWRCPGLMFRPGLEDFVEQMVPLDPLYLADQSLELLDPAVKAFTPAYQRRLRQYVIREQLDTPLLDALPNGQFGYCFAYNYFNFKPLEIVKQYLDELWTKLRPGGVVFFTFNDCDFGHGVELAEKNFMCYTPGHMILNHAEDLGFELLDRYRGEGNVAWMEFRKPGEITSIRGGQTLAKIVARSK
jgi:hypothetical protein